MTGSRNNDKTITIFCLGDTYLFSHYFNREDLFVELCEYYDNNRYVFEIPDEEFKHVKDLLIQNYYNVITIEDIQAYCVVIDQYKEHADILQQSVLSWKRRGHRFFLMDTEIAVKNAVNQGATRISETEFALGL